MFAQNVKIFFLVSLFFFSTVAQAKKTTLGDGNPLGIGFAGGIEKSATSDFIQLPQSSSNSYGQFGLFEPFLDFTNFVVKFYAGYHLPPGISSSGTNSTGTFNESSKASIFTYGGKILLAPFISQRATERLYFSLGLGYGNATVKSTRSYTNGSQQTYNETAKGSSQEISFGTGFEFIFVQNYSIQIEGGYREMKFNKFTYTSSTDITGATKTVGSTVVDARGGNKKLKIPGYYANLSLNLNF